MQLCYAKATKIDRERDRETERDRERDRETKSGM